MKKKGKAVMLIKNNGFRKLLKSGDNKLIAEFKKDCIRMNMEM